MALDYRLIQKKNPLKPNEEGLYYAILEDGGEITLEDLLREIQKISRLSTIDSVIFIETFKQVLVQRLCEGKKVRVGDLGSFRLILKSKGTKEKKM
jgi:predicted histone-like DNA-binding protein